MPRPKSIPWEKRVAIFLDHRRLGKVKPTAKLHNVARSTVAAIVQEFEHMGFSKKPRAKLPTDMLREMQEQHLASLGQSPGMGVGQLNLGPGTHDEAGRQTAAAQPLPVTDEVRWHLKGTRAEQVIREAEGAARDYLRRESEAWESLRLALERACTLQEREGTIGQDKEPHLLPALKCQLWAAFSNASFQAEPPPLNWLQWDLAPEDPRVLRLQREQVAIGGAEDHERLKNGVTRFLEQDFREHQRRFAELDRLRRDMGLVQGIVNKALGAITEDAKRRGICPACPYPEARLAPDQRQEPGSPRAKEEARRE